MTQCAFKHFQYVCSQGTEPMQGSMFLVFSIHLFFLVQPQIDQNLGLLHNLYVNIKYNHHHNHEISNV